MRALLCLSQKETRHNSPQLPPPKQISPQFHVFYCGRRSRIKDKNKRKNIFYYNLQLILILFGGDLLNVYKGLQNACGVGHSLHEGAFLRCIKNGDICAV